MIGEVVKDSGMMSGGEGWVHASSGSVVGLYEVAGPSKPRNGADGVVETLCTS